MISELARSDPFAGFRFWRGPKTWSWHVENVVLEVNMLSDAKIRAAKPQEKPYKLTDSHRLYLLVNPGGSKLWKWSYAYDGKQKTLHFGVHPRVSLQDARVKRDEASVLVNEGRDPGVVRKLMSTGWPSDVIINVNFPALPPEGVSEIEVTRQGFRDHRNRYAERRTDLRGRDYFWLGFKGQLSKPADGTDLAAIYQGRISVTPLHIDLTHMKTVHDLKAVIGGAPPKA